MFQKGKVMPALVWIHFKALSDIQAECKYCAAVLTVTNGSTKGLWTHVSRKHPREHLTYDYETAEAAEQIQEMSKHAIVRGVGEAPSPSDAKRPSKQTSPPEERPAVEKPKRPRPRRKRPLEKGSVGALLKSAFLISKTKTEKESSPDEALPKTEPAPSAPVEDKVVDPVALQLSIPKCEIEEKPNVAELKRKATNRSISEDSQDGLFSTLTIKEEDESGGEAENTEPSSAEWREILRKNGYHLAPDMEQSGGEPIPSFTLRQLSDAFRATVSRDYERAIAIVRHSVKTDHAFSAEDLELLDHVFACVLNTSHYDETMIEVCWEWIEAFERHPRTLDARVVAGSQLSIYFAYHTICRVQERMPRKPNYIEIRRRTWSRIVDSFGYLSTCASALWKPFELDRLDILVNWSYLALQYSDVCEDDTLLKIKEAKEEASEQLGSSVLLENSHQSNERINTLERNLTDICARRGTTVAKLLARTTETSAEDSPQEKKARMAEG